MAVLPSATLSRARGAHDQETGSKDVTPTMSEVQRAKLLATVPYTTYKALKIPPFPKPVAHDWS